MFSRASTPAQGGRQCASSAKARRRRRRGSACPIWVSPKTGVRCSLPTSTSPTAWASRTSGRSRRRCRRYVRRRFSRHAERRFGRQPQQVHSGDIFHRAARPVHRTGRRRERESAADQDARRTSGDPGRRTGEHRRCNVHRCGPSASRPDFRRRHRRAGGCADPAVGVAPPRVLGKRRCNATHLSRHAGQRLHVVGGAAGNAPSPWATTSLPATRKWRYAIAVAR